MNAIVALRGRGGSGKSTTIHLLYGILQQNGFTQVPGSRHPLSGGADFIDILTRRGKLLGITSVGDTHDIVMDRVWDLISSNCEVCVCACRSFDRGGQGTIAAIMSFTTHPAHYIPKSVSDPYNVTQAANYNQTDAQTMMTLINTLI